MVNIFSTNSDVKGTVKLPIKIAEIESIELLEGTTIIKDPVVIQYVNIQQNKSIHVKKAGIKHIDRCGQKIRCKVKFNKAGIFKFKVMLKPEPDNVEYTSSEKAKNANFKYSEGEIEFTTDPNGEKVIEADKLFVTPAGGDEFRLAARYSTNNEILSSSKIRNQRLFYYDEVVMNNVSRPNLEGFHEEYKKHGIEFKKLSSTAISYTSNIDTTQRDSLKERIKYIRKFLKNDDINPYHIIITYIKRGASKIIQGFKKTLVLDKDSDKISVKSFDNKMLWDSKLDGTDWFIEGYWEQTSLFGIKGEKTKITKNKCTAIGGFSGFHDTVEIDVSNLPKGPGVIIVNAYCIDEIVTGWAYPNEQIVVVCTNEYFDVRLDKDMNRTVIHEIGHKLHMACDGVKLLPDIVSTFYIEKGHHGPHCNEGLSTIQKKKLQYGENENECSSCVMYGAANGKTAFCENCKTALMKISLENGFE